MNCHFYFGIIKCMKKRVTIDLKNKLAKIKGKVFGTVWFGTVYVTNLNDMRIKIKVTGRNNKLYYGDYFHSCGNWAIIKSYKN